jgi:S1-C subfamily serine protease
MSSRLLAALLSPLLAGCLVGEAPPAPREIGRPALHAALGLARGLSVLPVEIRHGADAAAAAGGGEVRMAIGSAGEIDGVGLVTAAHLTRGGGGVLVMPDGRRSPVELIAEHGDLALLRGRGPVRLPLGGCPVVGDVVGLMGAVPPYILFGRVVEVGRTWTADGLPAEGFVVRAPMRPGFSGGPVVDASGRAIGMNSASRPDAERAYVAYLTRVGGPDCMGGRRR